jgi:hypothetical protein
MTKCNFMIILNLPVLNIHFNNLMNSLAIFEKL